MVKVIVAVLGAIWVSTTSICVAAKREDVSVAPSHQAHNRAARCQPEGERTSDLIAGQSVFFKMPICSTIQEGAGSKSVRLLPPEGKRRAARTLTQVIVKFADRRVSCAVAQRRKLTLRLPRKPLLFEQATARRSVRYG